MTVTIKERVKRLEDRQDLADLVARYCQLVDDRDIDGAMDLFTDGGTFRHADYKVNLVGRAAIHAYFAERLTLMKATFHYTHGHQVRFLSADRATGVVSAHAEHGLGGETVVAAIRYHDVYERDGGSWRFAERALHFYYFSSVRDYATIMSEPLRFTWPGPPRSAHIPEMLGTWRSFMGSGATANGG